MSRTTGYERVKEVYRASLHDIKFELTATSRKHEATFDGWGPNDLSIDKTLNMLKDRIPFVASPADGRVCVCAQQEGVGAIDTSEAQLTHRLRHRTRIIPHVGRDRQSRIAASLTDTLNPRRGVSVEDGAVFGKGDFAPASF